MREVPVSQGNSYQLLEKSTRVIESMLTISKLMRGIVIHVVRLSYDGNQLFPID
jgi:hypothetical protein